MPAPGPYDVTRDPGPVFRVGYEPNPWAWTDWSHASNHRFTGRWDSEDGSYRTIYAGHTVHGCLVEILARFRPDPSVAAVMNAIVVDDEDEHLHPTVEAGTVDASWFERRRVGRADLAGRYCIVTGSRTIAALRPTFLTMAREDFALDDFDASALQNSKPRALTQRVGLHIYSRDRHDGGPFDGVRFPSRHGEDITLWAIFEQPGDGATSSRLERQHIDFLDPNAQDVSDVLRLHGLTLG